MIGHIGEFGVCGAIVGTIYAPRPNAESRIPDPESR